MKKIIIMAMICMPILLSSCAKTVVDTGVTIYGTVYDATTFSPIQGAMLTLQPSGRSCYTGSDGAFNFEEDLDPLQYTITAQADGYRTDRKTVKLTPGESSEVTFALKKE
ncbi:MAG: carboxypeptidase regulatory-like domain-containing protein [Paludibacteraceae bacterium]|nr:carboxypeptidase regulatory-like domain-containing protein [Paludibacteraceae bacterium]